MNAIGVIMARFQSPYLHEGHRAILQQVMANHNKVVIILGVSPVLGSRKNPLDFHTRMKMIASNYPEVVVLPLANHPLDSRWSSNLDVLLMHSFPGSHFKLYGGRDSFIPHYSGRWPVVELPETTQVSATQLRHQVSDRVSASEEFRTGIIYAYSNTYPKVYPTVDIAVFRNNKSEILLGKKNLDDQWRLLGGFADPKDESFEVSALRELSEECNGIQVENLHYEKSFRVNDWRYRDEVDKIITSLFSADFLDGDTVAGDDIDEVGWFTIETIKNMMEQHLTNEAHAPLLNFLLTKYSHV